MPSKCALKLWPTEFASLNITESRTAGCSALTMDEQPVLVSANKRISQRPMTLFICEWIFLILLVFLFAYMIQGFFQDFAVGTDQIGYQPNGENLETHNQ